MWGATSSGQPPRYTQLDFNPRAPCGARPRFLIVSASTSAFQSTRPVWGATRGSPGLRRLQDISIHAPRVGRDEPRAAKLDRQPRFQSTRPVWGATWLTGYSMERPIFQSTRPVWGATPIHFALWQQSKFQSTRPVWGATFQWFCGFRCSVNFNPRAPCGARPRAAITEASAAYFNPRAPCGARLTRHYGGNAARHFNPRAPCGARPAVSCFQFVECAFQSTRPVWGATANLTILPRQIFTKGTKEFLLGRKTHGKKEK